MGPPGVELSPNQLDKQRRIVEAAKVVLARDGLAACTARAVADAGPLTKSAIHYYFADMDELIDLAMTDHITASVRRVRDATDVRADAPGQFWSAVREYLAMFREVPGGALLWFDYWTDAVRRRRTTALELMQREIIDLFGGLATAAGAPADRERALFRFLLGTVVDELVAPRPFPEVAAEIADLCRVDRMRAV